MQREISFLDQLTEKVGQQEQVICVLSVASFPCSGIEDDASKVVEAAASVVAVSMLTSDVSVVDADELHFDQRRLLKNLQRDSKLACT